MEETVRFLKENFGTMFMHRDDVCHQAVGIGVACDGKVSGHQVCRVYGCEYDIISPKVGFCDEHEILQKVICRVDGCKQTIRSDCLTCSDPAHMRLEEQYEMRALRKAMASNNEPNVDPETGIGSGDLGQHRNKDARKNARKQAGQTVKTDSKLKANFGRRYVPCILFAVYCCGIILNCEKHFTQEGSATTASFLKKSLEGLMQKTKSRIVVFYDTSCILLQYLRNNRGTYDDLLQLVRFVVDRFHFKTHKKTDNFCREYCDPDAPDLEGLFNSSIAESTNSFINRLSGLLRVANRSFHDFLLWVALYNRNMQIVEQLKSQSNSGFRYINQ